MIFEHMLTRGTPPVCNPPHTRVTHLNMMDSSCSTSCSEYLLVGMSVAALLGSSICLRWAAPGEPGGALPPALLRLALAPPEVHLAVEGVTGSQLELPPVV